VFRLISDFINKPWSSALKTCEHEIVAVNIMVILKTTGDKFRDLTWEEYKSIRLQDGNFSEIEHSLFDDVIPYCKNADTAKLFSKSWRDE
jgi:hypothetical protein